MRAGRRRKLTLEQVAEVRAWYAAYIAMPGWKHMSRKFNVSPETLRHEIQDLKPAAARRPHVPRGTAP